MGAFFLYAASTSFTFALRGTFHATCDDRRRRNGRIRSRTSARASRDSRSLDRNAPRASNRGTSHRSFRGTGLLELLPWRCFGQCGGPAERRKDRKSVV